MQYYTGQAERLTQLSQSVRQETVVGHYLKDLADLDDRLKEVNATFTKSEREEQDRLVHLERLLERKESLLMRLEQNQHLQALEELRRERVSYPIAELMEQYSKIESALNQSTPMSSPAMTQLFLTYQSMEGTVVRYLQMKDVERNERLDRALAVLQPRLLEMESKLIHDPLFHQWKHEAGILQKGLNVIKEQLSAEPWMQRHDALKHAIIQTGLSRREGELKRSVGLNPLPIPVPSIYFIPPQTPFNLGPIDQPKGKYDAASWANFLFDLFNRTVFSHLLPPITLITDSDRSRPSTFGFYSRSSILHVNSPLEHTTDHNPFAINLNAYTLGRNFVEWKNTMLHEMCHYWVGLMEIKCHRRPMISHGPDWIAVCCHAMAVYPDIRLTEVDGQEGVKVDCDTSHTVLLRFDPLKYKWVKS